MYPIRDFPGSVNAETMHLLYSRPVELQPKGWAFRAPGYARTSKHLSQCTKTSELRDDLKGNRGSIGGFSNLLDECRRSVAKKS